MLKRTTVVWVKLTHRICIIIVTFFKLKRDTLFFCHCAVSDCHKRLAKSGVELIDNLPPDGVHKSCTRKVGELYIFSETIKLTAFLVISRRMAFFAYR